MSTASTLGAAHRPTDVWNSFTKIERDGRKLSKCNLCHFELSGWLAGNARKHLLARHVTDALPRHADEDNVGKRSAPNELKNEIEDLNIKKTALIQEVAMLTGHHTATSTLGNDSSHAHTARAQRSTQFDLTRHREHNKAATRRWRERIAERNTLRQEIAELESNRDSALRRNIHAPSAMTGCVNTDSLSFQQISPLPSTSGTPYVCPTYEADSLHFISTRSEIKLFNAHLHREWYMASYVDCQMQLYQHANRRLSLAHLSRHFQLPIWIQGHDLYSEWLLMSENDVVGPNDELVKPCIEHHCWQGARCLDDGTYDASGQVGFVVEYGCQRLGGLFIAMNESRRTITVTHAYIRRDLLCSTYYARFLSGLLKAQGYHRWFERLELTIPAYLTGVFDAMLIAGGAIKVDNSSIPIGQDQQLNVAYSFHISDLLQRFF